MALPALIGALAPVLGKVLDRVLPDPAARANAEAEMQAAILEHAATLEQAAASIIRAGYVIGRSAEKGVKAWRGT